MEGLLYELLIEIEQKEGCDVSLLIAHHTFMNVFVADGVMQKRAQNMLSKIPVASFCHGTAIKMYENELNESDDDQKEYPLQFLPVVEKRGFFDAESSACVDLCYAVSLSTMKAFTAIFSKFPQDRMLLATGGYKEIFRPIYDLTLREVLTEKLEKLTVMFLECSTK